MQTKRNQADSAAGSDNEVEMRYRLFENETYGMQRKYGDAAGADNGTVVEMKPDRTGLPAILEQTK